ASRPAVDFCGSGRPTLKAPHSAWPNDSQPLGEENRSMIFFQLSFLPTTPAASASGFGMAITVGVRPRLGCRSGIIRSASASTEARRTHAVESGTHASGAAPSVLTSHSPERVVATNAESLTWMSTLAQVPFTDGSVPAHSWAASFTMPSRLGLTRMFAEAEPEQAPRMKYTYPAPTPATASTAMVEMTRAGARELRRRGPPRRCA